MSLELDDFIKGDFLKYAVITRAAYDADDIAKAITSHPAPIGDEYIIISLEPLSIRSFADYIKSLGFEFDFGFAVGSGKVSLLNRKQAIELKSQYSKEEVI